MGLSRQQIEIIAQRVQDSLDDQVFYPDYSALYESDAIKGVIYEALFSFFPDTSKIEGSVKVTDFLSFTECWDGSVLLCHKVYGDIPLGKETLEKFISEYQKGKQCS